MTYRIGIDARMYSTKFTGIGRYNAELIKHILTIDEDNTYVLFMNEPEYSSVVFTQPNVEKVLVGARHYSLGEQLGFWNKLNTAKLDLMHFTHFNNPILYRGKQVVTIHDLTLSYFPGKKMTSPLHRLGYNMSIKSVTKKAATIISISDNTSSDLEKLLHISKEKIVKIYEGASDSFSLIVDQQRLDSTRKKYNLEKPFFIYAGVWRDHKNVVGMIKAFKKVRDQGLDMDLVITGRKDGVYQEVPNIVVELGLEEYVHFVGLVPEEDLVSLYNLANTYVFPSFYEGFGLPALEAYAVELPVAASNTSCLPEICADGAAYFDPNNIEEMAQVMTTVATNEDLRRTLIANGTKQLKKFSWETMAAETHQVYIEAIEQD